MSYTILMDKYYYVLKNDNWQKKELRENMTFLDAKNETDYTAAICALRNNELESLIKTINTGDYVKLLSSTQSESASRVFLRGATMLVHTAARELGIDVLVEHVIYGCVFCRIDNANEKSVEKLRSKIEEYIELDEKFSFTMVDINCAKQLLAKENMTEQVRLLKFRPFDYFRLYWFRGHCGYFHGIMPPSSGYLNELKLTKHENGFIMSIPNPYKPACGHLRNQKKYSEVFSTAENWAQSMNSSYIADLNEHYLSGKIEDIIKSNEQLHEDGIKALADTIISKSVRVVLIAGPSSSGKTTFANRLTKALKSSGVQSLRVSIDDYYKNRIDVPSDETGRQDFESLEAIDTESLEKDISALVKGEEVALPVFDFVSGTRKYPDGKLKAQDEIIIVEGIHGLNDSILSGIERRLKYKIFIAPLTALNFDKRSVVLPEDLRLLRRLVRDKRTRGFSFSDTFEKWNSVRTGEYKYILPYQESADVMFNTSLIYEPLVFKKYCYEELISIPKTDPGYIRAQSMLKFLNYFLSLEDESAIPEHSLLREFIGSGK